MKRRMKRIATRGARGPVEPTCEAPRVTSTATNRTLSRLGLLSDARAFDRARAQAPVAPPGTRDQLGELRAAVQLPRLLAASPRLLGSPRGDGRIVIDIPGWKAPESSGAPIRAFLRLLGHDARGWGIGTNRGDARRDALKLADRVVELAESSGRQVALVGWSLGGVIAREVARNHPASVSRVVTYGSPVVGGPAYTVAAASYGAEQTERITAESERLDSDDPIRVPITAIFTRRDGVVDWRACIDWRSSDVEHVEVGSTHIGLGIDPDVWQIAAARLAA